MGDGLTAALYVIVAVIHIWVLMSGTYRHFNHILQLNSYYNSRYGGYLKKNVRDAVDVKAIIALLAYLFLLLDIGAFPAVSAYALIYLLLDMAKPKKEEKKPLVVTDRVKRLMTTECVLALVIMAAGFFVPRIYIPLLLFAAAILAPVIVMLANVINAPVEKGINKKFYNSAKEKLEMMPNLKIIGITGSYGKTSVKNFVTELLSEKYNTLMTPASYNTTMGVVRTINENLSPLHDVFVVEMGARNKGDIKEICDLVKPQCAIVTSIGPQHLETFKTIETIIDTKFELVDAVGEGYKFLNYDNEYIRARGGGNNTISYGTDETCDFYAKDIKVTTSGSEFTLVTKSGEAKMKTKLLGEHNVVNLVGAAAVAVNFGMTLDEIAIAMRRIESVEHRLQLKKTADCTIIDDAYNSNPSGAKSALETLSRFEGCRIVITPGMVELGEREVEENEKMGAIAAKCSDVAIFVGQKQAPALIRGAAKVEGEKARIIAARDIYEAFAKMREIEAENKVVLLENDLPDNYL
ncbi:MAG: UDP-N-acetylmuramoyl-tripeptide--D-alanyl-D-alanine ligase [Clostridia bacterium]|nr:UDP-N-acetylmuramoyl-tripeptide--D-alanyl-D-alanine ligase [Clostridia bacterium]